MTLHCRFSLFCNFEKYTFWHDWPPCAFALSRVVSSWWCWCGRASVKQGMHFPLGYSGRWRNVKLVHDFPWRESMLWLFFSALLLLVWWQEGHPTYVKPVPLIQYIKVSLVNRCRKKTMGEQSNRVATNLENLEYWGNSLNIKQQ